jgi:type II secretory pathway component PulJ
MIARHRNSTNAAARKGITIIEVMIVVTCVGVVLGLCAVTIQALLRLEKDGQKRYLSQASLERLARQLRIDAHAATGARVEAVRKGESAILNLSLGSKHSVMYEPRKSAVMRVESRDGNIQRRELYALPAARTIGFELIAEEGRQFVLLSAERSAKLGDNGSSGAMHTVALVGKDRGRAAAIGGGPQQ